MFLFWIFVLIILQNHSSNISKYLEILHNYKKLQKKFFLHFCFLWDFLRYPSKRVATSCNTVGHQGGVRRMRWKLKNLWFFLFTPHATYQPRRPTVLKHTPLDVVARDEISEKRLWRFKFYPNIPQNQSKKAAARSKLFYFW